MSQDDRALDSLAESIAATAKYRYISPQLVRAIGAKQLAKGSSWKSAVKATKSKLHQIAGAYQRQRIDYERALRMLQAAGTPQEWRDACRTIMGLHASTQERLPILDEFYVVTLQDIPAPRRVLDIACGLNPLASSWMPLADGATYVAYDIYGDMMQFLQDYVEMTALNGRAEVRDVIHAPPREVADLALLLKTLPCLEQAEKGAATRLLDAVRARYLLISYPVSSLGGRQKGMVATYDAQFAALLAGRGWSAQRFLFSSELAFLVDTQGSDLN
jgi:16S rRNA (guanine(1405)-N(7))-methyltransferase